jgi:hypothetical protein
MKYVGMMLWVLSVMLTVGCSSTREYSFNITVRNESPGPVTIWLTKEGPPIEQGWRSPEQVAVQAPGHEERISGVLVPPGKTASTGPIKGKFEEGSSAWLRIYDGKYPHFSDLLAVSPKSSKRVDQPLDPGVNRLVVKTRNGTIYAEVDDRGPTTQRAK